jgi:DNA-binding LytR/AlgR family response regulator/two-component sensor histidine kinase
VLGYTDLLGSEGGDPASPDRKQILERMQQAIERMQAILAETMFVAKSRMQRLPFDPAPADLRHVCEMLVSTHEGRDRLHLTLPEFELRVVMDVVRVRQALENVVSNALKFSTGAVDIQLALHQGRFQITIVDSGIGVPTAEVSKLGEPFFRASNAAQYPGNGLGLCIVKACVEQHGGSLKVSNNSEQGIQVILELPPTPPRFAETRRAPLAVRNVVPAIPAAAGAAPALLSVMIVDDDALVRGMLRDILERAEAARVLSEAGTGAEARLLLEQQTPDVIFLDVHLPDVSGFDLLHELKPATSVIFLSHAEEHAAHAFDCDAVDFLLKPVTAERVLKSLEKVRSRQSTEPIAAAVKSRLDDTFLVKTLTEKRLVKVGEIRNIAAYGEYSWVYWDQGKGAMLRKPLKQWLGELPEEQFLRVHRGAIVNLAYLEKVERLPGGKMQIRLRDTAEPIQVSLRLASTLNRRLKGDG